MENKELDTEIKITKFKTIVIIILTLVLIGLCTYIVLNENLKKKSDNEVINETTTLTADKNINTVSSIDINNLFSKVELTNEYKIYVDMEDSTKNGVIKLENSNLNLYFYDCDDDSDECDKLVFDKKIMSSVKEMYNTPVDCKGIEYNILVTKNNGKLYNISLFTEYDLSINIEKLSYKIEYPLYVLHLPSSCGEWIYYYKKENAYFDLETSKYSVNGDENLIYYSVIKDYSNETYKDLKVYLNGNIEYDNKTYSDSIKYIEYGPIDGVLDIITSNNYGIITNKTYTEEEIVELEDENELYTSFIEINKKYNK